jgi:putative transposase
MATVRSYTAEARERAVTRGGEIGPTAASQELGIPSGTIANWQHQQRRKAAASPSALPPASPAVAGAQSSMASKAVEPESAAARVARAAPPRSKVKTVAKVYTPSQRAEALELSDREGVTAASAKLGISRFSLHDWRRKARLHAEGKASDSPVADAGGVTPAERDQRILAEWKSHPGLGPSQVRNQMRRQGLKVSVHTVRCVLEANGYVTPRVRREVVADQNYEAVRPNHLWHLDFLHRYVHKQKVYVLIILDDHSRFIVGCAMWEGERVAAVIDTFHAAVARYGKPEKAMSDGGSAFYSWKGIGAFTRELTDLEVDQLIAQKPSTNGKLEVLNANVQKELFNQEMFFDLGEAQRRLQAWVHFYNFRRTHHALGGLLVPADRYFGRADEVLASIEAGQVPDGNGELVAAGERHLDLFRVSSYRGQVEVMLLGQRILLTPPKTA